MRTENGTGMTCGTALVRLARRGIAWDSLDDAIQLAMDAKFVTNQNGKVTGWKKASEVKCHAKDPNNCRFHKTGKFAKCKDAHLFDVGKFGPYSPDDVQAFLREQMEAKGVDVKALTVTEGENGTMSVGYEVANPMQMMDGNFDMTQQEAARGAVEDFVSDIGGMAIGLNGKDCEDLEWEPDGAGEKCRFVPPISVDAGETGKAGEVVSEIQAGDTVKSAAAGTAGAVGTGEAGTVSGESEAGKEAASATEVTGTKPGEVAKPSEGVTGNGAPDEIEKADVSQVTGKEETVAVETVAQSKPDVVLPDDGLHGKLDESEAAALNSLAELSGVDGTWFALTNGEDGWCITDTEEGKPIPFKKGVSMLIDSADAEDWKKVSPENKVIINGILKKIGEKPVTPETFAVGAKGDGAVGAAKASVPLAVEGVGSGYAGASESASKVVAAAKGAVSDAQSLLPDDDAAQEAVGELNECLDMLDGFQESLGKATGKLAKQMFAKNIENLHVMLDAKTKELAEKVGKAKVELEGKAKKAMASGDKDVEAAYKGLGLGSEKSAVGSIVSAVVSHSQTESPLNTSALKLQVGDVGVIKDCESKAGWNEAILEAKKSEKAWVDAEGDLDQTLYGGVENPSAVKSAMAQYEKATEGYVAAVKALGASANKVKAALQDAVTCKASGIGAGELDGYKKALAKQPAGTKIELENGYLTKQADGSYTFADAVTKSGMTSEEVVKTLSEKKQKYLDNVGESVAKNIKGKDLKGITPDIQMAAIKKALSNVPDYFFDDDGHFWHYNPDDMIAAAKVIAKQMMKDAGSTHGAGETAASVPAPSSPSGGYSHAAATKAEKVSAAAGFLEKQIAACQDPAMKAKYEKALAALKAKQGGLV